MDIEKNLVTNGLEGTLLAKFIHWSFLTIRLIFTTYFCATVTCRYFAFALLLDTFRMHVYDYCISLMEIMDVSPTRAHFLFCQLRICHVVLAQFYSPFSLIIMVLDQLIIAICWWATIISFGKVHPLLWLMFPIIALNCMVGIFMYMEVICGAHTLTESLVAKYQRLHLRGRSKRLRALWRSAQILKANCSSLFHISRKTILHNLNIMLNSLATLVLIRRCWECSNVL